MKSNNNIFFIFQLSTNNAIATAAAARAVDVLAVALAVYEMHIYKAAHLTHSVALGRVSILLISEPGAIISHTHTHTQKSAKLKIIVCTYKMP